MVGMNTVDIYLLAQQQAFRIHDAMRRRVIVVALGHRRVLVTKSFFYLSLYIDRLILVVARFITDWSGSSSFMRVALRTYF